MEEKDKKQRAIERLSEEIKKISEKKNNIYFFVYDTKGNPNGGLEYIYKLAKITGDIGYKTAMLYQTVDKEDEFVGVGEWLGEEYASIPHYNIAKEEVDITPSDVVFIPELFTNVMNQTKKLPCKRVAIFQNYDYLTEQMPFAAQWGDFGIMEAITNTKENEEILNDIFPYVKTHVVDPYIDPMFGTSSGPKKLVVNIVSEDPSKVNKIIKPFYWKFPLFRWVSFRDLRGFPKENFAELLRDGAITIWADDNTSFGYSLIEALKSGSIVIAKVPDTKLPWTLNENGEYTASCIWFYNINKVHEIIANVVRAWMTDRVPEALLNTADEYKGLYPKENTITQVTECINGIVERRQKEMQELYNNVTK